MINGWLLGTKNNGVNLNIRQLIEIDSSKIAHLSCKLLDLEGNV